MKHTLREVTLKNGAEGLIINVPGVEVVRLLVEFRAGFDLNSWEKYELPHVMEHMMFTNKTYPKPRQFSREIERNGAFNNAYTSGSSLEYDYESASFEAARIADLLRVQITEPIFPEDELATELGNVAEELNGNLSDPGRSAHYNLYAAASGAPSIETRIQQLASIGRQDLHEFYQATHSGANMRFILAGDMDFDPLISTLDTDKLPEPGERAHLPHIKTKHVSEAVVEQRDIPQIYYSLFSSHPRQFTYRELIAARIMTNLLSNGFSSTLYGAAREKGLVYGLSMGVSADLYETGFSFGGAVTAAHASDYFSLAYQEIAKVCAGEVENEQFEATKISLRGQRARQYQKLSNLIGYYGSYFTIGYQPFEMYEQLLDEITLDEAVAAFKTLLASDCWGLSFVGDIEQQRAEAYRAQLAPLFVS